MKKYFFVVTAEKNLSAELSIMALRVFAGLVMAFGHGLGKLPPPDGLVGAVAALGFPIPFFFAWMAALAEFAGGLLLALGLFTRPAAFGLVFTMGVAAFGAHATDPFKNKEMALLYLFVALIFMIRGAGRFSIDRFLGK